MRRNARLPVAKPTSSNASAKRACFQPAVDEVFSPAVDSALEPSRRFMTQVSIGLSRKPRCQVVYGPTGVRLGTLDAFIQERLE